MLIKTLTITALAGCLALIVTATPAPASQEPANTASAPQKQANDDTLKDFVNFKLETSDITKKYDVHVKVQSGVVTLTGDVATAAQKAEAGRLAQVTGVVRVQNDITIDPDEDKSVADRIRSGLTKTGERITDAWITTKVNWILLKADDLDSSDIRVDTKDGVVTLKGTVKNVTSKTRAFELANKPDGVKKVVDQLTVK